MKRKRDISICRSLSLGLCVAFFYPHLLHAQQESLIITTQKLMPSVVNVTAVNTKTFQIPRISAGRDTATGRIFLLRNLKTAQMQRDGAGVILDASGLIVTNAHIIANADHIMVTLNKKKPLAAQVVKIASTYDLALIKINSQDPLQPIIFSDSDKIKLGDDIVTIGSSQFLNQTISGGKIIGIGTSSSKSPQGHQGTDLLQTTINVYKGDSGGPLFDTRGHLVGLMVAGQIKKDHSSFAVPSNIIKNFFEQHITDSSSP